MPRNGALLSILLLLGCTEDRVELIVDLRTDFVPGHEFGRVVTQLEMDGTAILEPEEVEVDENFPALDGSRIAEYADLKEGTYRLMVRLLDQQDEIIVERPVELELRKSFAVTVLITRDCRGVVCDDPERAACLGGLCVPATCTPETDADCDPPACVAHGDCGPPGGVCGNPVCISGSCFLPTGDCPDGEYCEPLVGCRGTPPGTLTEAGPLLGAEGDDSALDVAILQDGQIAVVGWFEGRTPEGQDAMGRDGFVTSISEGVTPSGVIPISGDGTQVATSVAVDFVNDEVYVGGYSQPPGQSRGIVVHSYNQADGLESWVEDMGAGQSEAWGVEICGTGIHVVGQVAGDLVLPDWSFSSGSQLPLVALFPNDHSPAQYSGFGADGDSAASALACATDGTTLVTGTFRGTGNFGGVDVTAAADTQDAFVSHLALDLTAQRGTQLRSAADISSTGIAIGASGSVYVVGAFEESVGVGSDSFGPAVGVDGYLAALDSSGALRWARVFSSGGDDSVEDVAVDAYGNIFVTGAFGDEMRLTRDTLDHASGQDIFVASFDSDGNLRWARAFGGLGEDKGLALVVDNEQHLVHVVGHFSGVVDFGGGNTSSAGGTDAFLLTLGS